MGFLLEPDFSKISFRTVMVAIGQAFFSIGIGMAAMITFGAYLPEQYSIARSALTIIIADTSVALLAGFAIFPLVFQFGLEPSGGAGLIFQTLPPAFGQMPGGAFFGAGHFLSRYLARQWIDGLTAARDSSRLPRNPCGPSRLRSRRYTHQESDHVTRAIVHVGQSCRTGRCGGAPVGAGARRPPYGSVTAPRSAPCTSLARRAPSLSAPPFGASGLT